MRVQDVIAGMKSEGLCTPCQNMMICVGLMIFWCLAVVAWIFIGMEGGAGRRLRAASSTAAKSRDVSRKCLLDTGCTGGDGNGFMTSDQWIFLCFSVTAFAFGCWAIRVCRVVICNMQQDWLIS